MAALAGTALPAAAALPAATAAATTRGRIRLLAPAPRAVPLRLRPPPCRLAPAPLSAAPSPQRWQGPAGRWPGRLAQPPRAASAVPSTLGVPLIEVDVSARDRKSHSSWPSKAQELLTPFSDSKANARLLALCIAQALSSVATLMHETYLPVYLSDVLHLSNAKIGNLQALSMFLSKASGCISGTLADLLSPARMVLVGTALTTLAKPMFAASGAVYAALGTTACLYWITFAKLFDRVSKGVREAPSKALIGELAAQAGDSPAAAFALRQTFAMLGMLSGSLVAALAFKLSRHNYALMFGLATLPAALALGLVSHMFGRGTGTMREAACVLAARRRAAAAAAAPPPSCERRNKVMMVKARAVWRVLSPAYWQALGVVAILYFARFDTSFATLRAKAVMSTTKLPLLLPFMLAPQALAPQAGLIAKASVRGRNSVLLAGIGVMVLGNLCFAFVPSTLGMMAAALCVGTHMALTHGVSMGMLASYIPVGTVARLGKVSGTAWSLTDMLLGVVLALSNSVAGQLCDWTAARGWGGTGCFFGGITACALSAAALLLFSTFGELGREELVLTRCFACKSTKSVAPQPAPAPAPTTTPEDSAAPTGVAG